MAATLFLVDDEGKVLDFMSLFLRKEGFQSATARAGKEALQIVEEVNPTLVV